MPDVTIARADDWTVLYIDGKKKLEDHSLRLANVLRILGFKVKTHWVDDDWAADNCPFPDLEKELPPSIEEE